MVDFGVGWQSWYLKLRGPVRGAQSEEVVQYPAEQNHTLRAMPKWPALCGLCNIYKSACGELFFWISWVDLNQRITRMLPTLSHNQFWINPFHIPLPVRASRIYLPRYHVTEVSCRHQFFNLMVFLECMVLTSHPCHLLQSACHPGQLPSVSDHWFPLQAL